MLILQRLADQPGHILMEIQESKQKCTRPPSLGGGKSRWLGAGTDSACLVSSLQSHIAKDVEIGGVKDSGPLYVYHRGIWKGLLGRRSLSKCIER